MLSIVSCVRRDYSREGEKSEQKDGMCDGELPEGVDRGEEKGGNTCLWRLERAIGTQRILR